MKILRLLALAALLALPASFQAQGAGRYATYRSPVSCLGALMRNMITGNWDNPPDTLPLNPDDMIPQPARDSAAQCYQRFYPAGPDILKVPDQDVASLFFWGRATGNDSLAARAFRRALGHQKLRIDTTDLHWHGTYAYSSRPYRLPVAQAHAARLDSLGVVGERPMMPIDDIWQSQHDGPKSNAKTFFDTLALRVETEGELRNYRALPDTAKHGAEMTGIMTEAQTLLLTLVRNPRADSAVKALKARAIEVLGKDQQNGRWGEGMLLLGDRFAPMRPDFWFNLPGRDSVMPRPGRVTLLQVVTVQRCFCEQMYASIGRMKKRFGDSLDVVLLVQTQGHWARRVQLSPAEEAALLKRAVLDSVRAPVALGVYTTTYDTVPAPDNRLMAKVIPELKHIFFGNGAVVIDRRGIVQLAGVTDLGAWNERAMNALVASLLSAPAD